MVGEILTAGLLWFAGRFLPWSTLVSLALWWGRSKPSFKPFRLMCLLVLGVIEDISRVSGIGVRPAILITLLVITWLIARYYQNRQLWWWFGLAGLGEVCMMLVNHQSWSLIPIIGQWIFLGIWELGSQRFGKQDSIYVQD